MNVYLFFRIYSDNVHFPSSVEKHAISSAPPDVRPLSGMFCNSRKSRGGGGGRDDGDFPTRLHRQQNVLNSGSLVSHFMHVVQAGAT